MVGTITEQKATWRARMRQQLGALDAAERAERSRRLVQRLTELPTWRAAATVLLFAPLPVEPDLDLLWRGDALAGKQVAYPRVEGTAIRLYYVRALDELEPSRWGLREPLRRAASEAILDDFELVLVPGLAFDSAGGRLGHGGGYYDRLLAPRHLAKTHLVGVGYAFQYVEKLLPSAEHDVKMDEVCMG